MTESAARNPDIHVLEQLTAVLRRRWALLLAFVAAGLILGFLYAEMQVPQYATSSTVMVRSGFAADPVRPGIETTTPEEEGQFLSQLEYIGSSSVAAEVASKLDLENDPDFAAQPVSGPRRLLANLKALMGSGGGNAKATAAKPLDRNQVIAKLQAGVKAMRAGRTYVAAISFQHPDPAVAPKVAQAYAVAFRQKLAEANDMANSRARASVEAELARATGEARTTLEQKYQDMLISRVLPGVDAIIISDAKKPVAPIAPRKGFMMAVGAILAAALGCLLAGWLEMRDRGVRDGDSLARRLGTRFLGYCPDVAGYRKSSGSLDGASFALPQQARIPVESPFSRFSETVRSAAVALGGSRDDGAAKVAAVVSTLPGEGKTLFAANLAAHLGNQGRRVLLIDGHFRDPDLTRWLAGRPAAGLAERLLQSKPEAETVLFDRARNVSFLPAAGNGLSVEPSAAFSGAKMAAFIAAEAKNHDVILIDLPSLTSASDAAALEPFVDCFVLVAEWGSTPPELIETVLAGEPGIRAKLAGVAITRTNLRKLARYVDSSSRGAFQYRIG